MVPDRAVHRAPDWGLGHGFALPVISRDGARGEHDAEADDELGRPEDAEEVVQGHVLEGLIPADGHVTRVVPLEVAARVEIDGDHASPAKEDDVEHEGNQRGEEDERHGGDGLRGNLEHRDGDHEAANHEQREEQREAGDGRHQVGDVFESLCVFRVLADGPRGGVADERGVARGSAVGDAHLVGADESSLQGAVERERDEDHVEGDDGDPSHAPGKVPEEGHPHDAEHQAAEEAAEDDDHPSLEEILEVLLDLVGVAGHGREHVRDVAGAGVAGVRGR